MIILNLATAQENLPIQRQVITDLNSLLSSKVAYPRTPEARMWVPLRAH